MSRTTYQPLMTQQQGQPQQQWPPTAASLARFGRFGPGAALEDAAGGAPALPLPVPAR